METYDEWRVTGTWHDQPFERIFSPKPSGRRFNRGYADPEAAAHQFVASASPDWWTDGPHLQRHTVTVTEWEDAGPPPLNRPHPTCIDVTATDQTPRSAWTCGPECPKEA
jgi:hypothetical protein